MLETESVISVSDIAIVEAKAIAKGDRTLIVMIVKGTDSKKSEVR